MDDDISQTKQLLDIHGYLALVSLIAVFPISILVAALGPRWDLWLIAHIGLVLLGTLIFVASIVFGVLGSRLIGHIQTTHQILGLCLLVVVIFGILTGIYISVRWDASRTSTPNRDKFHWWFCRTLVLLSFAMCFQGFVVGEWGIWAFVVATACWLVWICVYAIFKLRFTPLHRRSGQQDDTA